MCGGGLGNILKAVAPIAVGAFAPELLPAMGGFGAALGGLGASGLGALTGAGIGLADGGGLTGALEGGLSGYGMGGLGGGLGSMGSALANGAGLGSAFASGFPNVANFASNVGKDVSGGLSDLGSMFSGSGATASSIPTGTIMNGFSTGGALSSPTALDMATQTGSYSPMLNAAGGNLAQIAANGAGGASTSLGNFLNTGSTLSNATPAAGAAGATGAAAGGGASAYSSGSAGLDGSGFSSIIPQTAQTAGAAMSPASTGGNGMKLNLGALLSGTSGLMNSNTLSNMQKQEAQAAQQNQAMIAPFVQGGQVANNQYENLLTNPNMALENTPGYQFQLQQGNNALNNQMSASGLLGSGAALKAAQQFGQGLAGTTYQNAINNALGGVKNTLGFYGGISPMTQANTGMGNIMASGALGQNNNLLNSIAGIFSGQNPFTLQNAGMNGGMI